MRTLEKLHPLPCFLYFIAVIGMTIFSRDPVILVESLFGAVLTAALSGRLRGAAWLILTAALAAVTNPLFSHKGATPLFFVGDTAFTLEALLYGAAFGVMLAAAVLWGASAVRFMTSDKYIWIFGSVFPAAGLVLSCAIRFVPLFISRTAEFAKARRASSVGDYLGAFSAALSYSSEEAMSAADSMKSRGYGTGRRGFYSSYRLTNRDIFLLVIIAVCGISCAALTAAGAGEFYFYPALSAVRFRIEDIALYADFGTLCALPAALIMREEIKRGSVNTPDGN
ncbi:MAG: energy-coupling factor transporter transmembrane protein EcfT [Oscillospiraceae bacterium]|nr:energy-coupling factor transporter transmembrane protein EcfT [Oscillospiraceae bacterium]